MARSPSSESSETPVVAICTPGETYGVILQHPGDEGEGDSLIILGEKDDRNIEEIADVFIPLPSADSIAGLLASNRHPPTPGPPHRRCAGKDIDRPRNLAKSVTVE